MDDVVAKECEKGIRLGMLSVIQYPELIIEDLTEQIEVLTRQLGDVDDE